MRLLFAVAVVLAATTATVQAQVHPCDNVAPTVFREPSSQLPNLRLGWCYLAEDVDGYPLWEPVAFSIQVNSGPHIDLGIVPPLVGPNAGGFVYYEAQSAALGPGVITISARTGSLGMSAPSPSITLTLQGRPKSPSNVVIARE